MPERNDLLCSPPTARTPTRTRAQSSTLHSHITISSNRRRSESDMEYHDCPRVWHMLLLAVSVWEECSLGHAFRAAYLCCSSSPKSESERNTITIFGYRPITTYSNRVGGIALGKMRLGMRKVCKGVLTYCKVNRVACCIRPCL